MLGGGQCQACGPGTLPAVSVGLWEVGRWGGGRPGSLYPVPTSLQLHTQLLRSQAGQWAGGSLGRVEKGCPGTTESLGLGQVKALLLAVTPALCQAGGRTGNKMFRRVSRLLQIDSLSTGLSISSSEVEAGVAVC